MHGSKEDSMQQILRMRLVAGILGMMLVAVFALPHIQAASIAILVKDINPPPGELALSGWGDIPVTSYTRNLARMNGFVYFVQDDSIHGSELWRTDGTPAGTTLVKDVNPGHDGSYPMELTVVGSKLFFVAHNSRFFPTLWRSDGTAAGTTLVHNTWPGAGGSDPSDLTIFNDTLFFSASDGVVGRELWKHGEPPPPVPTPSVTPPLPTPILQRVFLPSVMD
jgi:ELWxxDGT repeat protein